MPRLTDGNFIDVSMVNGIVDRNLRVAGNLIGNLDCNTGTFDHLIVYDLNVNGTPSYQDNSIPVHKFKHNMFIVPTYIGEVLNITDNFNSLRLKIVIVNKQHAPGIFNPDSTSTFQLFITYYDDNGDAIIGNYQPGEIGIEKTPANLIVNYNDTAVFELYLSHIHQNKPENAKAWSLTFYMVTTFQGSLTIGYGWYVDLFVATPYSIPDI